MGPVSGLWEIGWFVTIEFLLNGVAAAFLALVARRTGKPRTAYVGQRSAVGSDLAEGGTASAPLAVMG